MKNLYSISRLSVIKKIILFCLIIGVVSCEELTDNLTPRDNILDTWKCVESSSGSGTDIFLVEIEADALSSNGVKIYNFNLLGDNFAVKATVTNLSISIQSQKVDGFTISGSGTIDSGYDEINLSYSVDDGGGRENYNAVLTKP